MVKKNKNQNLLYDRLNLKNFMKLKLFLLDEPVEGTYPSENGQKFNLSSTILSYYIIIFRIFFSYKGQLKERFPNYTMKVTSCLLRSSTPCYYSNFFAEA